MSSAKKLRKSEVEGLEISSIGNNKGTFCAKMGIIRDKNCKDPTEEDEIKKRWQEYTEDLYKKDLNVPDNYDGVIAELEPHILECEIKQALERIANNKASESDGIPVELLKILKDNAVNVMHTICQQLWKTQ